MKKKNLLIIGSIPDEKHKLRYGGVTILTKSFLDFLDKEGVRYRFVQNNKYSNLKTGKKRNKLNMIYFLFHFFIKVFWADVVMFNFSDNGIAKFYPKLNKICRKLGKKTALRKFGGSMELYLDKHPDVNKAKIFAALDNTDLLFIETKAAISHLQDNLGPEARIQWSPNSRYPSPVKVNPTSFSGKCVFMSQIDKEKGINDLIAVKRLLPEDYTIDVYGYMQDAEYESFDWQSHGLAYHGEIPSEKILRTLCEYSFLLLPSYYREGHPGIIIEALSCGIPCVATNVGGIPEVINEGYNGCLFNPGDLQGFKDAILRITPDNYHEFSSNALRSFESNFNANVVNKQIMEGLLSM